MSIVSNLYFVIRCLSGLMSFGSILELREVVAGKAEAEHALSGFGRAVDDYLARVDATEGEQSAERHAHFDESPVLRVN